MVRAPDDAEPPPRTVSQEHFTNLYLAKDDPWDNASKWADRRKYAVVLASLPREHYRRGYEPGCAIGELTRLLAPRCADLLAVDCVAAAVDQARAAVAEFGHVRVAQAMLPADLPDGTFDLIVVGDLLYYLSGADLAVLLDALVARLEPGGDLVAAHFRDRTHGGGYDGHRVHEALARQPGLDRLIHHDDEWFTVDVLRRTGG